MPVTLPELKKLVREDARLVYYKRDDVRGGCLWYQIICPIFDTADPTRELAPYIFDFPIPISDAEEGEFRCTERGLTLMRWIRPHLELLKELVAEEERRITEADLAP